MEYDLSHPDFDSDLSFQDDNNNVTDDPSEFINRLNSFLEDSNPITIPAHFPIQDNNTNVEQDSLSIGIDPSEVESRLNSFFEDSNPRTFPAQENYSRPFVDTTQNCPHKQRRSSVITTLKEALEGISIQPPQIKSKEYENIYSTKEETCQVLPMDLSVATPHSASVDSHFQVIHEF